MINKRLVNNMTNMTMMITLYVQAGNDLKSIYGTLNITLQTNESRVIEYGDLRNGYLLGAHITPSHAKTIETYYALVRHRGDAVDNWLNKSDAIDITIERLFAFDSRIPIERSIQVTEEV